MAKLALVLIVVLAIAGLVSCLPGDPRDRPYSGPTYVDKNGKTAPSDCSAWAESADNPLSYSAGWQLCEEWKF